VAGGAVAMSMAAKVTLVTVTAAVLGGGSVSVWAWKKHKESTQAPRAVPTQPRVGMVSARSAVVREMPAPEQPAPVPAPVEVQRRVAKPAVVNPRPVPAAPVPTPMGIQDRVPAPALVNPRPTAAAHVPTLVEPPQEAWARPESWRRPASPSPVTDIAPTPAPAPRPAPESLDSELNLLRQAQEDLRLGLPARALRRLAGFDRRFPKARLDQERQAIEAIANCQVHPGPAARARAQRFLQNAPLSPLAARVGSACMQDDESRSLNETSARREP
jgi:hypothetical protein